MRRSRVVHLLGALLFHVFGALTWYAFLGFSSDAGTDRQFYAAVAFGAATWLATALLMAWVSFRSVLPIVFVWLIPVGWWYPSFLLMVAIVYGW